MIPEGKKINLDMTPREDYERLQKWIASFGNMAYPFVDVWNFQVALAFMVYSQDGTSSWVERLSEEDMNKLGVSQGDLIDAIEYQGGAINRSGHYPISGEIKQTLRAYFGQE